ncbi:MAG: hypothetical protein AAF267_21750, partial [Deinococcota bacterium]
PVALRGGLRGRGSGRRRDRLGDPLFLRSGRNIEPSEFLLAAMPRVDDVLARLEALQKPATFTPGLAPIDITMVANVNELLPMLVGLRDRLFQLANVSRLRMLELGSRDTIADRLEDRDVDLAISVRMLRMPLTLASAPVYQNRVQVFYDHTRVATGIETDSNIVQPSKMRAEASLARGSATTRNCGHTNFGHPRPLRSSRCTHLLE